MARASFSMQFGMNGFFEILYVDKHVKDRNRPLPVRWP